MLLEAGDQFHRHATFGCDPYCIVDPGKLRLWTCVPGKTCGSRQLSPIDELPEPMIPLSPLPLPTTFPILDTEPDSTFGPGRYAEPEIDASWETRSDADSGSESGTEAEIVAGEDLKTSSSLEPDSIPIQEVDLASQEEENVDSGYASGSDSPHSAINTDSPPRPAVNLRELADRLVAIHSQQNSPSHSTTTTIPSALSIFNPILIRRSRWDEQREATTPCLLTSYRFHYLDEVVVGVHIIEIQHADPGTVKIDVGKECIRNSPRQPT